MRPANVQTRGLDTCSNCGCLSASSLQPDCRHQVCVECVKNQMNNLPRLAGKGYYLCFECGARVVLPPTFFELANSAKDSLGPWGRYQPWRTVSSRGSAERSLKTYSTEYQRPLHVGPPHPVFGRVVEVNHLPTVTHTYRATTSQTRDVSPPVVRSGATPQRQSVDIFVSAAEPKQTKSTSLAEEELTKKAAEIEEEAKKREAAVIALELQAQKRLAELSVDEEERKVRRKKEEEDRERVVKKWAEEDKDRLKRLKEEDEQRLKRARQEDEERQRRIRQEDEERARRLKQEDDERERRIKQEDEERSRRMTREELDMKVKRETEESEREKVKRLEEDERRERRRKDEEERQLERQRLERERELWEKQDRERQERFEKEAKEREKEDQLRREKIEKETKEREREVEERRQKMERDRLLFEKEEKERRDKLDRERAEREKEDRERRDRLDKEERDRREKMDKEELERRARWQREEKEEKERLEKERAIRLKDEEDRKAKLEREAKERLARDTAERERLEKEWRTKMDEEKAEREKQEQLRIERQNLEKKRWEEERAAAEKRDKEKFEAERQERQRLEAIELERLKQEQLEISKKAQEEITRLENSRLEFKRIEEERIQKIKDEQDRIAAEKEMARKLIEMVKSSRTPKEHNEGSNRKSHPFKNLVQVNTSYHDSKHLDLPSNSVLSTSMNTVNSTSKYFQSLPHTARSKRSLNQSAKTKGESQMEDLPDCPSLCLPKQRLPLKKELAVMRKDLNLDRFEDDGPMDRDEQLRTEEDFYSKSLSRGRYEGFRNSGEGRPESPVFSAIEKETQKCWEKIKENASRQREASMKHFSIQENQRPTSRSNSAKKSKCCKTKTQSVEGLLKVKKNDPKRKLIDNLLTISDDKHSVNHKDTIMDATIDPMAGKSTEFRDNFYRTKSIIKLGIGQNPLMGRPSEGETGAKRTCGSTRGPENSHSNSKRDIIHQSSAKSFFDSVGPLQYSHQRPSGRTTMSTCGHQSTPCCSKFGAHTASGTHCCHCFLIRSDIRNSNQKYNSALVTLNAGSVLRSLIKESHCEETH